MWYQDDENGGVRRQTLEVFLFLGENHEMLAYPPGCRHSWAKCIHMGVGSRGSLKNCDVRSSYRSLAHSVCRWCGCERYSPGWLYIVSEILESRREDFERSFERLQG